MTAASSRRATAPMSLADSAWLRMEHPANRMIITALLTFDGALDSHALQALLERIAALPRFHQRVVPASILAPGPRWRDDPRFDLRAHVHHVAVPPPGGDAGLRQLISGRMSEALDPSRALWELDVIDRGAGPSALLVRVHHCIGDGVALVRVLLGLADEPGAVPPEVGKGKRRSRGAIAWVGEQLARARSLGGLLALSADPATPFRTALGPAKRAAFSAPIPVPRLRALARAHHATVNDVLLATLAGVLRSWLIDAGHPLPGPDLRALVPVFLGSRNAEMGNRFGLVFVDLPIGESEVAARIGKLKQRMDAIKSSPMAPVAFDVLRLFGFAGPFVERLGVEIFTRKASVLVTNVPGPRTRLRIAGRELESVMVWAPTSGSMGLSVTLLSYGGELRIGIAADAHLAAAPEALVRRFERALAAPVAAAQAEAQLTPF